MTLQTVIVAFFWTIIWTSRQSVATEETGWRPLPKAMVDPPHISSAIRRSQIQGNGQQNLLLRVHSPAESQNVVQHRFPSKFAQDSNYPNGGGNRMAGSSVTVQNEGYGRRSRVFSGYRYSYTSGGGIGGHGVVVVENYPPTLSPQTANAVYNFAKMPVGEISYGNWKPMSDVVNGFRVKSKAPEPIVQYTVDGNDLNSNEGKAPNYLDGLGSKTVNDGYNGMTNGDNVHGVVKSNVYNGYGNKDNGYKDAKPNVDNGYVNAKPNANNGYDSGKPFMNNGYNDVKPNGDNDYGDVKSYGDNGYIIMKPTVDNVYNTMKPNGDHGYDNVKPNGDHGYDNVKPNGDSSYDNVKPNGENGYGNMKPNSDNGYSNVKPNDDNGYVNQEANDGNGYVNQQANDGNGYVKQQPIVNNDYGNAKPEGNSGYVSVKPHMDNYEVNLSNEPKGFEEVTNGVGGFDEGEEGSYQGTPIASQSYKVGQNANHNGDSHNGNGDAGAKPNVYQQSGDFEAIDTGVAKQNVNNNYEGKTMVKDEVPSNANNDNNNNNNINNNDDDDDEGDNDSDTDNGPDAKPNDSNDYNDGPPTHWSVTIPNEIYNDNGNDNGNGDNFAPVDHNVQRPPTQSPMFANGGGGDNDNNYVDGGQVEPVRPTQAVPNPVGGPLLRPMSNEFGSPPQPPFSTTPTPTQTAMPFPMRHSTPLPPPPIRISMPMTMPEPQPQLQPPSNFLSHSKEPFVQLFQEPEQQIREPFEAERPRFHNGQQQQQQQQRPAVNDNDIRFESNRLPAPGPGSGPEPEPVMHALKAVHNTIFYGDTMVKKINKRI